MAKRVHEVWEGEDGSVSMFLRGAKGWRENLPPNARRIHVFEAESAFDAFRTYYRLMGWGEWRPMLGMEDKPYPNSTT